MKQLTFTEARIRQLPAALAGTGRVYWKDSQIRGLCLAVSESGRKTFIVYRKVHHRPERIAIGPWPDVSVIEARKRAEQMNAAIGRGENPADDRRQKRLEGTLGNLFVRFIEEHAKLNKRPRSVAEDEALWRRYLKPWEQRQLSEIRTKDVRHLHDDLRAGHGVYPANRTLALLKTMFNKAIKRWDWKGSNPCNGIDKFEELERERFLTGDEMPRFLMALKQEANHDFRDFLMLDLLTGARRSNLMEMEWAEIDFAGAVWRIPVSKFKGKRDQSIPLVPVALNVLKGRRAVVNDQRWVFPGAVAGKPIQSFRKPWERLLKRAEITNLRLHDVRRTLGSWMSSAGAALPVIKTALGHQDIATTLIYTRSEDTAVREALNVTAVKMLGSGQDEAEEGYHETA
jgi:integrase